MTSKNLKAFAYGVLVAAAGSVAAEFVKGYIRKQKAAK